MTCTHVLNLIDAGELADVSPDHLDRARAHARDCATCGPALAAAAALTSALTQLPHPRPPADLTAPVLARIAQIAAAPAGAVDASMRQAPATRSEGLRWAVVIGLQAAAIAIVLAMTLSGGGTGVVRITGGTPVPGTAAGALALALGSALYVAGLLAPLGRRRRSVP